MRKLMLLVAALLIGAMIKLGSEGEPPLDAVAVKMPALDRTVIAPGGMSGHVLFSPSANSFVTTATTSSTIPMCMTSTTAGGLFYQCMSSR